MRSEKNTFENIPVFTCDDLRVVWADVKTGHRAGMFQLPQEVLVQPDLMTVELIALPDLNGRVPRTGG